jgi:2-dehydropantoate 2-reductase
MRAMRIAIVGSGGVGGYFGGRLAATGVDVTFIARGAHLAAMRERGLRIESPGGNLQVPRVSATDDPASVGPVDIVFFTVKLYDTESALAMLPPLIGPQTLVIPFQNGVDSVERLTETLGRGHVAGGTTYVTAVIAEPGVIRHTAMERLLFGPVAGPAPAVLEELRDAGKRAGFDAVLSDRILVDIWTKFARLSVFSGITAVTRSPIGVVRADPDLRALMETALHESIAVARGKQIPLLASTFADAMAGFTGLPPQARSSMLEDLERGRRLELPWLSGAVVRIGDEVGVDAPTHRLIVALLKPHVHGKQH